MHGLLQLPWWGYILVTLFLTQITIFCVTIFLHRCQAHRALELHPIVSHFFRLWLWLTTGMVTKEWTAIHRKHHAKVETADDPHSPQVFGLKKVFWQGVELYKKESRNKQTLERYGQGTPDDWMEKHVYTKHSALGILITFITNIILFGPIGITIWALQMAWIPFFAAGVINGVGHYVGYRNFECPDASRNVLPWGFIVGGEELHNNHHTFATSAKFSVKWWELDVGWWVIRALQMLGLAKPKRLPPKEASLPGKKVVDLDTLKAIITNRFHVMARYSKDVIKPVWQEESKHASTAGAKLYRKLKTLLMREVSLVDSNTQQRLTEMLKQHHSLEVVYQYRLKLQSIWAKSTATPAELLKIYKIGVNKRKILVFKP